MKLRTLTATIALMTVATAAIAAGPRIGQVKTASGEAVIVRHSARLPAKPGDPVYADDLLQTGEHGSVGITFIDNTVFSAGPNSEVALDTFRFDAPAGGNEMLAELRRGTLSVVSGDITKQSPGALKIKTPTAVLGVRGTTFAVKVAGQGR